MTDKALVRQLAIDEYDLRDELLALRKKKFLSQSDVALRTGWSTQAIKDIEDFRTNITLSELRIYAWALGARIQPQVTDFHG